MGAMEEGKKLINTMLWLFYSDPLLEDKVTSLLAAPTLVQY